MKKHSLALLAIACSACSLVVPLDDLRGSDAAPPSDAASDAGDAGDGSSPSGLVASWPFDEDSGTTAHDVTGHGHDGVLSGGTWTAGHSGGALLLDGTAAFVAVPTSPVFDKKKGGSFTVTAWVMRVGSFSHHLVFSVSFGASSAMYGLEGQSNTLMNYWDGVSHIATGNAPFTAGEWHHTAIVVDTGLVGRTYFDGVQVGSGGADDTAHACTAVMIGASNYGDFFPGAIDELRYYDHALTTAEITNDMSQ